MKSDNVAVRQALLSLGVLLLIIPSSSNALRIELSMSPYGQDCQMGNDAGPGLRTVYVLHGGSGMLGVRFKVSFDGGADLTYISETHPFAMTSGNTQDGITVCYGSCTEFAVVTEITYLYGGSSVGCPRLRIVPHPDTGIVEQINCYGELEPAHPVDLVVLAPGAGCGCGDGGSFTGTATGFSCSPVPVEQSTWGHVKALYR